MSIYYRLGHHTTGTALPLHWCYTDPFETDHDVDEYGNVVVAWVRAEIAATRDGDPDEWLEEWLEEHDDDVTAWLEEHARDIEVTWVETLES